MQKDILVRPIITEKGENLGKKGVYAFIVHKKANKLEIAQAVEKMFTVSVAGVNTVILPGKAVSRSTKTTLVRGMKPSYKKAYVTLQAGEKIVIYGESQNN